MSQIIVAFIDFAKILLPAALVLYGMFLTTRSFLNKDFEKKLLELKIKHFDTTVQIRLQAYERMALYLERITPTNLLTRLNDNDYAVAQLHAILLTEIRQEYNYNLSQQIYMSDDVWQKIKTATDQVTSAVNDAAAEVAPDAPALELVRKIFEIVITGNNHFTTEALVALKTESQLLF